MLALLRHHAHRIGSWPRRVLALAFLALAAVNALDAGAGTHASDRPATVTVVVAGHDLPVGHVLTGRDLRARAWPATVTPPGAHRRTGELVGRRLAGPVARGEPVTSRRLLGRDLTAGLAPGQVAAAVPLDDPHISDLAHPGDRVDVLAVTRPDTVAGDGASAAARPATPSTIADGAVVLAVLADAEAGASVGGSEVIVAATRDIATRLAAAGSSDVFTIVGRAP